MDYTKDADKGGKFDRKTTKFKNVQADDHMELPCQGTRKLLAFLGAVPCSLTPPYLPSLSLTKSSLVYCVVVYSIFSYDVVRSAVQEKRLYDEKDPSNIRRTQHLEHILAMLPHFLGIHFWIDVPALLFTLERFKDLQAKFQVATGKSLTNRRNRKEKISLLAVAGVLCFLFFAVNVASPPAFRADFSTSLACLYGNVLAICATYLLMGLSWGIHDAAADTKAEFRRQLDSLTPSKVYNFRLVWLSMRTTLDSMAKLQSPGIVYSVSLWAVVVLFYESSVLAQSGEMAGAFGHLISGTFYVSLISLMCRTSHCVQEEMKCLVGEVLPNIALTSYDIKIQREIVMLFLIENARPAVTNFHGFLTVNKLLILSFFSNISTYIIVLVQFSVKSDSFGV